MNKPMNKAGFFPPISDQFLKLVDKIENYPCFYMYTDFIFVRGRGDNLFRRRCTVGRV